ncbi:putative polyamine transporter [Glycine soja]
MGLLSGAEYVPISIDNDELSSPRENDTRRVSLVPLVFLIFYEVSGGPFGVEDTVHAAGPLLALLGFLIFPFIWSVPEALITAEMGTISLRTVAMWFGIVDGGDGNKDNDGHGDRSNDDDGDNNNDNDEGHVSRVGDNHDNGDNNN